MIYIFWRLFVSVCFIMVTTACETDAAKQGSAENGARTSFDTAFDLNDSTGVDTASDEGGTPFDNCESISEDAGNIDRPVDIIIIVDNSYSMAEEIAAVEANLNNQFAEVLFASGIDYRFILISFFAEPRSAGIPICIGEPLSPGATCCVDHYWAPPMDPTCSDIQTEPMESDRFFHYGKSISSTTAWCNLDYPAITARHHLQ